MSEKYKTIVGRDVGKETKKVAKIVKKVMEEENFNGQAMIIDVDRLNEKQREALTWLVLAQTLCGKKCIDCGYQWNPNVNLGYDQNGIPKWRQLYQDNPALGSKTKGEFICTSCFNKEKVDN